MSDFQQYLLLWTSLSSLSVVLCCLHQEREYVVKSGRTLVPTPLGRLLAAYLTSHFSEYVDVNFTAKVEEQLDEVSGE